MQRMTVRHTTIYRYASPVTFGPHRLMFRPRDSHDLRLVSTALEIRPKAQVRWLHDVFGNSIAIATFREAAQELRFDSRITLEHYGIGIDETEFPIEDYAKTYPFSYPVEELPDLGRTTERHYPDPEHRIDAWVRQFVLEQGPNDTSEILIGMTRAIKESFRYQAREDYGVQNPAETLRLGSGSCRDFALLMMEAARCLGFAAHFVTGYLYVPALDSKDSGRSNGAVGGGATHAWVAIYLPGAGWVEFDPTNGIIGGPDLIRVAVARDPSQTRPLSGTFTGPTNAFLGMTVDVAVTAE